MKIFFFFNRVESFPLLKCRCRSSGCRFHLCRRGGTAIILLLQPLIIGVIRPDASALDSILPGSDSSVPFNGFSIIFFFFWKNFDFEFFLCGRKWKAIEMAPDFCYFVRQRDPHWGNFHQFQIALFLCDSIKNQGPGIKKIYKQPTST